MCGPVEALSVGLGAVQSGKAASAANKQASRNYQHQLKVRERNWMGDRSLYQTKLVQHSEQVDLANVAAQRAYTRTQISLNNAQSLAILENQEDWKKMLANEGTTEAKAASRGVGGKGIARQLAMNKGSFGMTQAMRTRGLTMAQYEAKASNEQVRNQLKGFLNQSYGEVALQPFPDLAPPRPVMQNALLAAVLGGAQAGLNAYSPDNPGWGNKKNVPMNTSKVPGEFGEGTWGSPMPSNPQWGYKDPNMLPPGHVPGRHGFGSSTFNPYQSQITASQIPFASSRL